MSGGSARGARAEPLQDRLRIVSHFPGRLRVRAETFRVLPEVAEEVASRLLEEEGVTAARTNPTTGSLLVTYEPRELQLPRIIAVLVRIGGLRGIEVDASQLELPEGRGGDRVRARFGGWNESVREATRGKIDLRVAVPGALAGAGIGLLLGGRFVMPFWYDFLFWSFVTFHNMNPRERERPLRVDVNDEDEA